MAPLRISQTDGVNIDADELGDVLLGQRRRFLDSLAAFDADRWAAPTRCGEWDAHTTFRHVADAAQVQASGFTGIAPAFQLDADFNPQTTPDMWLAHSIDETPEATLERYAEASGAVAEHAVAALKAGVDRTIGGPYGPAHWSVVTVHVMWDAWLHERDIFCAHEGPVASEAQPTYSTLELKLAGMYAALMATVPLLRLGDPLHGVIGLGGAADFTARFGGPSDQVLIEEADSETETEADVFGDLLTVADALGGRGSLHDVLSGDAEIIEKMSFVGQFI